MTIGPEEQHDMAWTAGLLVAVAAVLGILSFESGRGVSTSYAQLFQWIFVSGIAGIGILLFATWAFGLDPEEDYTPTFWSTSRARGLADKPWAKVAGMVVLIMIFAGGAIASQHSVIPIINPYDAGHLIGLDQFQGIANTFLTGLRSGGYAGIGEDTIGFVIVNSLTLGLLGLSKLVFAEAFSIIPLVLLCGFVACIIWAFLFATAHAMAYGINLQAYVSVAFYGFLSQLVNFMVGAPVSIVAHFAHNFLFIIGVGIAFSLGVLIPNATKAAGNITAAAGAFFAGDWLPRPRPLARRANAALVALLVVLLGLVIVTGVYLAGHGMRYDLGSTTTASCGGYTTIPGPVPCTTVSDCQQGAIAKDHNIMLQCSQGVCQARFLTCGGTK